ncbi:MAG: NirD/YgiW/YdeI family stress tolerance protein [Alphaproteobacteria bacterium]|nr:NirD/YgiW/YdeI family stress tolerance protein [Alphaproteobacteria bacterium]
MKKTSLFTLLCILATGVASADFSGPDAPAATAQNERGGFISGAETVVTIKQVNEMRDDVPVIIQGKIIQRMGDEKYLFEDGTGSITIEIDDDNWRGQNVTPEDTVKMYGETDRGLFSTEIDIDYIEKL